MTTISVMMEKKNPRIPQPKGLRPFIAATTAADDSGDQAADKVEDSLYSLEN